MAHAVFEVAKIIAQYCRNIPGVDEVWLFGSVATDQISDHDIDLVLVVDPEVSSSFIAAVNEYMARISNDSRNVFYNIDEAASIIFKRRMIAERILGKPINPVTFFQGSLHHLREGKIDESDARYYALSRVGTNFPIDVFLFPADWRENPKKLEEALPAGSSGLVTRMAAEARLYDPKLGDFIQK